MPRLGLVVGKKIAKKSVDRNYMRRVLRECFRTHQHVIPAVDLVIRVQKKFDKNDFVLLQQEFLECINKLKQRVRIVADNQLNADIQLKIKSEIPATISDNT